ncbi:MAG: M3 family metallopeptidase [Xanthomonadales bacterium]|nr:M3 family metallopeptidase [Xanthomonadales bacterium]
MDSPVNFDTWQSNWFSPVTGLPQFSAIDPADARWIIQQLIQRHRDGVEAWLEDHAKQDAASHNARAWEFVEREEELSDAISKAWSPISHLQAVADHEELREAYKQCLELLTEHQTWRSQNPAIYRIFAELRNSPEFDRLLPGQQRIVEVELRDFHLAGVDLNADDRKRYAEIMLRMSKLGAQFQENLLDATQAWNLHIEQRSALAGLPESELRLLAGNAAAHDQEGWLIDLSYPSYAAIITYAEDRDLRHEVYKAFVTRASDQGPQAGQWDNTSIIDEKLSLRHQLALLLGFANYAEYALVTRMAGSPKLVMDFLEHLAQRALPPARKQFAQLQAFALANGATEPIQPWDLAFWSERYRMAELQLSDEILKPYFPLDAMFNSLCHTARQVFGITLEIDETVETWDPAVRFYWLNDASGQRIAGMYVDLFTRKVKRGGAWMDTFRSRRTGPAGVQLPIAFLNCNFPPPQEDHPSLLTHHDVETLFHEFGHCLHHMLTEVDWPQINGLNNVEWDAVELPSQLLENWCWEENFLDGFARHYSSGQALPADLKERLLRSRKFQKATQLMRQLEFALDDFRLHLEYNPEHPRSPLELIEEVRQQYGLLEVPEWNRFFNSFSHVFGGGYAAGYYSYLWAEQLAANAWERILEFGPYSAEAGAALRREILSVGASRPSMDSFVAFCGRPPQEGPLLRSYGLE